MSEDVDQKRLLGRVERVLLIRAIPPEMMAETTLLQGGGNDIGLGDYIEEHYLSDWITVSHAFTMRPDGSALLTVLVERRR
jgi:hypothetical protein